MRPTLELLTAQEEGDILGEGIALLENPGVVVNHPEALELLAAGGAQIQREENLASLPAELVKAAVGSSPEQFSLYDLRGKETVRYGSDRTYFNPGSSALTILDSLTRHIRPARSPDLIKFTKLVECLPQIEAQSTALVSSDVPEAIQDLYRLYLALCYQAKPIVTGVFRHQSWPIMKELLTIAAGGSAKLAQYPPAVFDICPTSPLQWSYTSCQNLLDTARSGLPIQIIPMPLPGATSPVTLGGTLVQAVAECLSGLVIAQLAQEGAPVVWGFSPAVLDMKHATAALGGSESWLLAGGYAQIGRGLSLPTQAYLGLSDSKQVDAQSGQEAGPATLLGALFGFSMLSGAGMLGAENCQSCEKLVLDAELIAQVDHFSAGLQFRESPLGLDLIRKVGHEGNFLTEEHTYRWFREELAHPSPLIDRQETRQWIEAGSSDAWQRAGTRVRSLLTAYPGPVLDAPTRNELRHLTAGAAREAGLDALPELPAEPWDG